jgi:hypothetical protein
MGGNALLGSAIDILAWSLWRSALASRDVKQWAFSVKSRLSINLPLWIIDPNGPGAAHDGMDAGDQLVWRLTPVSTIATGALLGPEAVGVERERDRKQAEQIDIGNASNCIGRAAP